MFRTTASASLGAISVAEKDRAWHRGRRVRARRLCLAIAGTNLEAIVVAVPAPSTSKCVRSDAVSFGQWRPME